MVEKGENKGLKGFKGFKVLKGTISRFLEECEMTALEIEEKSKDLKVVKAVREVKGEEQLIVCIDFDGTIARSDYPVIKGEMPYAREVIKRLKDRGFYVIIWTCRTGEELLDAINWLIERDIPFDRVNDHNPGNLREFGGKGGKKVYADVYIDDKNLGGFPGWLEVERVLEGL